MWTGMFQEEAASDWIKLPTNISDLTETEPIPDENIQDLSGNQWKKTGNISRSFVNLRSNGIMMHVPWEDKDNEDHYPLCKYRGKTNNPQINVPNTSLFSFQLAQQRQENSARFHSSTEMSPTTGM